RDDAFALHLGKRVELELHALLAKALVRLDEGPADVAVLDQPLAERDSRRARESDRGRRAGVRNRQHEVGLDRRLLGEALAHADAGTMYLDPCEPGVGPSEVEELEDALGAGLGLRHGLLRVAALVGDYR